MKHAAQSRHADASNLAEEGSMLKRLICKPRKITAGAISRPDRKTGDSSQAVVGKEAREMTR